MAATYLYNPLDQRSVKTLANGNKEIYHYDLNGNLLSLHYAAEQGHAELVQSLLAKGANKNLKDGNGDTAADTAKLLNKEEILLILNN